MGVGAGIIRHLQFAGVTVYELADPRRAIPKNDPDPFAPGKLGMGCSGQVSLEP